MLKFIKQRAAEETNLLPVLAMFLGTNIEYMLSAAGFSAKHSPKTPEDKWHTAKAIAQKNDMQWFLREVEDEIRMPENRLTIPSGSGIMFSWNFVINGGLHDDETIKQVTVQAFDDGLIFDPCFDGPIPTFSYQQIIEDLGGKIVKIIQYEDKSREI